MVCQLKDAKDYQEQIDNLIRNHGLLIPDRIHAEKILSSVNYYRLSAYGIGLKEPNNKEMYLPDISLDHIYHLYQFDSCLRIILIPLIESVEISFKTKLAYHLALTYGAEGYRDPSHFRVVFDSDNNAIHQKVMEQLNSEIKHQSNLPFVKHHNTKYGGHFPVWVAMELFTFGMVCSLYNICVNQDKKKIASEFNVSPQHLSGWMLSLLELRNMCAHYNRIYNMIFKQTPYLKPEYRQYSGNKLFPKLLVLKALVEKDMWDQFLKKLHDLFCLYPESKPNFMGFPMNWISIL